MTNNSAPSPPEGERAGVRGRNRAREFRRSQTDAEWKLWRELRDRQIAEYKFRRQHPIGPYVADFACPEAHLIVELDGGQHLERTNYDQSRSRYFEKRDWRILRFRDDEALKQTNVVLERILFELVAGPSPQPSPRKRGEGAKFPA